LLIGAGGSFGFQFDDPFDDGILPTLLEHDGRVGFHPFQPADQIALLEGEFPADSNGPDLAHEVGGLALLQTEEGLYVPAPEERDRFGARASVRICSSAMAFTDNARSALAA
jgi:hypothetical protein